MCSKTTAPLPFPSSHRRCCPCVSAGQKLFALPAAGTGVQAVARCPRPPLPPLGPRSTHHMSEYQCLLGLTGMKGKVKEPTHIPPGEVHEPHTSALQEVAAHWGHAACVRHRLPAPCQVTRLCSRLGAAEAPRGSSEWC